MTQIQTHIQEEIHMEREIMLFEVESLPLMEK
jgi:hypothetical protein